MTAVFSDGVSFSQSIAFTGDVYFGLLCDNDKNIITPPVILDMIAYVVDGVAVTQTVPLFTDDASTFGGNNDGFTKCGTR